MKLNRTELLPDRPGVPPMAELPPAENIEPAALAEAWRKGDIDLICVLGPTASGKTRYAVGLAHALDALLPGHRAEILSADSRQVYRGMDIGTGKDLAEYGDVPYHLIDIAPAGSRYNIYQYQQDFERAYQDVLARGGVPILCGGSGLYIEAATCGYRMPQVEPDYALRAALEAEEHDALRARVLALRPDTPEGVLQSKKRTIRALEVALFEEENPAVRTDALPKKTFYIGTLVSREDRVARIDRRLGERIEEGLVEEVRGLLAGGIPAEDLVYYGLEYKYVTQHVLGLLSLEEMKVMLGNAIHQFAKRQMTWFRGMERDGIRIHWVQV